MMTGAIQLQEIGIHGDISIVTIDGKIVIMEDDPVYGDGFKGSVSVKLNLGKRVALLRVSKHHLRQNACP